MERSGLEAVTARARECVGARRLAGAVLLVVLATAAPLGAAPPPGFSDQLIAGGLGVPTALAFTPDGRLLVAVQTGQLRVVEGGALLPAPALSLGPEVLCSSGERGLLGVAVDPDFAVNGHLYLYYTRRRPPPGNCSLGAGPSAPRNRLSRFTLGPANLVDPASEVVLVEGMPSTWAAHDGGDVLVGRDGMLYVSVGDGGCDWAGDSGCGPANDAARDLHVLSGKVLRLARDGSIPADNPFLGPGTARCHPTGQTAAGTVCQEIHATGWRNPFRMALDPNDPGTRIFVNDVGQNAWEEVDRLLAGGDYGWNCREGAHAASLAGRCSPPPPNLVDPIFEYAHGVPFGGSADAGCGSLTGAAFAPNGLWPGYDGAYFFTDSNCGEIWRLVETPAGFTAALFAGDEPGGKIALRFGPHGAGGQALYYTTYADGGQLRRIVRDNPAGNDAPQARWAVTPIAGDLPLLVSLDASASSDPDDGDSLTYFWDFGDGGPEVRTATPVVSRLYPQAGVFDVRLRVRDASFAFSAPLAARVFPGNHPPVPRIDAPIEGSTFAVGEVLLLRGSATDPDQGPLGPQALRWRVLRRHDAHTHPYLGPVAGTGVPVEGPAPEDLSAAANSHLEIELTATDALGLEAAVVRRVEPRAVALRLETEPDGLGLLVQGEPVVAPAEVRSWEGWALRVEAPPQTKAGVTQVLDRWEAGEGVDAGAGAVLEVVTPSAPAEFEAHFVPAGPWWFRALSPCRLFDSRGAEGPWGGPALAAGARRRVPVAGRCGLPERPRALALNVTVLAGGSGGTLAVFPPGGSPASGVPAVVSFGAGATRAGQAVVTLAGGELEIELAAFAAAHVVLDVNGWFGEPADEADE